jgi:cyclic pyranopterin phosphate synthase
MPEEGVPYRDHSCFMTKDEVVGIAKVFVDAGVKKIRLTGGEPLVCKDARAIMLSLSRLPVELTITTNGILADKFIDIFREAGIRSVNVSLDTLDETLFTEITRRNDFKKVVDNIELLLKNDLHVKVNMVVMRGVNDDEVLRFVEWTKNSPLHVRFIEFMPFDGNKWNNERVVSCEEILGKISLYYTSIKLPDALNDTAKKYQVKDHKGTFAVISTISEPFCSTCNRLRLSSSGKIRNCLFSANEIDLLSSFRSGQDILPLIQSCVEKKFFSKGGSKDWEDVKGVQMVSIGG